MFWNIYHIKGRFFKLNTRFWFWNSFSLYRQQIRLEDRGGLLKIGAILSYWSVSALVFINYHRSTYLDLKMCVSSLFKFYWLIQKYGVFWHGLCQYSIRCVATVWIRKSSIESIRLSIFRSRLQINLLLYLATECSVHDGEQGSSFYWNPAGFRILWCMPSRGIVFLLTQYQSKLDVIIPNIDSSPDCLRVQKQHNLMIDS